MWEVVVVIVLQFVAHIFGFIVAVCSYHFLKHVFSGVHAVACVFFRLQARDLCLHVPLFGGI